MLKIVPIVEGRGEVEAIRPLIDRIWNVHLQGDAMQVLQPVRRPRHKILKRVGATLSAAINKSELEKAVRYAADKLRHACGPDDRSLILLLLDADEDCPAEAAPRLIQAAAPFVSLGQFACVLPNPNYETWLVASADSLKGVIEFDPSDHRVRDPETHRVGKGWIQDRMQHYSETVDQPRLTSRLDVALCRQRSPSFDKLVRELEKQIPRSEKGIDENP